MSGYDDDFGGLDDPFVPRHPSTGDPLPAGVEEDPDEDEDWFDEDEG